jgi:folate-binding protein YgfZ
MSSATLRDKPATPSDLAGLRAEFQALVAGCGVSAPSTRGRLRLTGSDRLRWLNGMVTNNIRDLVAGHGVYAFLLNPQGRILGDLYAYNLGDSLLVDTDFSQLSAIQQTFDRYIIMDDVEVQDISQDLSTVQLAGPRSLDALQAAEVDAAGLAPLEFREMSWRQQKLMVLRSETEKREAYAIWLPAANAAEFREAVGQAVRVSPAAWELYRIALGLPRYGTDIRERDLPQETEQARALNFFKGCYIGQEIVERIRSRGAVHRLFKGFQADGALPGPGTKIQLDGKDVGEITSAASLPAGDQDFGVALGYIRREAALPNQALVAGGAKLTVAEIPFHQVFN